MTTVQLAVEAMRVRFELVLLGESEPDLIAAGEAALEEIVQVEAQLSAYDPASDLWAINYEGADGPVLVRPTTIAFLQEARALTEATGGLFDPTVGALVALWRGESEPTEAEVEAAQALVGWDKVVIDDDDNTVALLVPGVRLDPGAIGKGWALDRAGDLLQEAGVARAFLHGGTSSVLTLGAPPDTNGWRVKLEDGTVLSLCDQALGVSAPSGRWAVFGEKRYGHVLDPRTGWPVVANPWAAVVCASATEADALSTALLVGGSAEALTVAFPTAQFLSQVGEQQR